MRDDDQRVRPLPRIRRSISNGLAMQGRNYLEITRFRAVFTAGTLSGIESSGIPKLNRKGPVIIISDLPRYRVDDIHALSCN